MGSTTIRLSEDVYERLRDVKRPDESFSEAVDRLIGGGTLLDVVGLWSDETVEEVRTVLEEADAASLSDADRTVDRTRDA